MEAGSDGESNRNLNQSSSDGPKKPKRQMKTPFQLETLERTYASETYPSEATRAELSEKLGLTDRQLQMWFCHRRLKDKKEAAGMATMKPRVPVVAVQRTVDSSRNDFMAAEPGSGHGSGSGSGSGSGTGSGSSQFDNGDDISMGPVQYHESPRSILERRVIACVEAQLGEPLREDGPILGMEFDELPPGAFGAPIAVTSEHHDQYTHSYGGKLFARYEAKQINAVSSALREAMKPKIRSDGYAHLSGSYPFDSPNDVPTAKKSASVQGNGHHSREYGVEGQTSSIGIFPQQVSQGHFSTPPRENDFITPSEDILQMEQKIKSDEARIGREMQTNEKKIQKELEKQDLLRRKMEEQMRKEIERQDRERRKEEQRIMREQQRKEERFQREERREMERREKFMQKELLRAERKRQKEEMRLVREAAKQKAAMERATARKIAKESTELIEDDRLELMELAASRRGLTSILSLDYDTLQNLDSFREFLCDFPPKSVQLKKPFTVEPWADSEVNVANLLMAWRFCINFADVLGLWPFTLDEFVQAFHDFDSRLLGEIHISLLKLIIKDIEDVVRTPAGGPGTNQYSAVNPDGGHPQIVEGAYLWGFDIRNWQKHLKPLTWPEILRQLALSAGFGPQLKKKSTERGCLNENDETKGSEDVVSTLRSGSAAENAVAIMQEKGFSLQRRSRHRLTPGTVKFAAYHVLALEGNKGLNVLDLAEKIQKSGLRDLTSSKTPEASISVALSRDPVLFERIAPSTYCVRPAFQKDPADAEAILSSAREKIQRYVNGFLAGQTADEEERDDDSEEDAAEDPEIDDLGNPSTASRISENHDSVGLCLEREKDDHSDDITQQEKGIGESIHDQEDTDIDESTSGEPWIQGLTEGEYSDLCVEERLNALIALIGVANEGNTVRAILEDRLDAAIALRKQMLAEAQLDKKRVKEELVPRYYESSLMIATEGSQCPFVFTDRKDDEGQAITAVKSEPQVGSENAQSYTYCFSAEKSLVPQDTTLGQFASPVQQGGYSAERSRLQLKSFISYKAEEMYVYRSLPLGQDRRRNRYWLFVAARSSHDPGSGRIFVETPDGCWRLIDSEEAFDALLASLDTRGIRESHLHMMLQKVEVSFKECVQEKKSYTKSTGQNVVKSEHGVGEKNSSSASSADEESPSSGLCVTSSGTWELSSSFKIELGRTENERENALKRYQESQIWTWRECFKSSGLCAMTYGKKRIPLLGICDYCLDSYIYKEGICPSCRRSFGEAESLHNYDRNIPSCSNSCHPLRIRLIKALMSFLEVCVPVEVLQPSWTEDHRKSWGLRLHSSSSTENLLQILTELEGIIKQDYLSSNFETINELLGLAAFPGSTTNELGYRGSLHQLPWIPRTSAAVAVRLFELDASISYDLRPKSEPLQNNVEDFPKLTSRFAYMKDIQKVEQEDMERFGLKKEENWKSLHSKTGTSRGKQTARGRGSGRPRKRWQKGVIGSVSVSGRPRAKPSIKPSAKHGETLTQVLAQQGETSGQKHGRGRRTVRKRRTVKLIEAAPPYSFVHQDNKASVAESPSRSGGAEELVDVNTERTQPENDEYSNSMEAVESEESDHETAFEYGNWQAGRAASPDRSNDLMEMSDEDADDFDDENAYDLQNGENMDVDVEDMNDNELERNEDLGSDSSESDDYSD